VISQETINRVVRTIVDGVHPERIILFGSYAKGTADEDSDLDLLVVADMPESPPRRSARVHSLFRPYPCAMDVFVYTPAEVERFRTWQTLVVRDALAEGRVLYERRPAG
jgi:predicted nucleotidyltransferase